MVPRHRVCGGGGGSTTAQQLQEKTGRVAAPILGQVKPPRLPFPLRDTHNTHTQL